MDVIKNRTQIVSHTSNWSKLGFSVCWRCWGVEGRLEDRRTKLCSDLVCRNM